MYFFSAKSIICPLAILGFVFSCTPQEAQKPIIEVDSVAIEQKDMTLKEGDMTLLTAKVLPENADDKDVKWSTSDESKVVVTSEGLIKAVAVGQCIIMAEAGKTNDVITILVVPKTIPVTGITLSSSELSIKVGESHFIEAVIIPEDATNKSLSWSSRNPEIATVEDGTVMGLSPGTVTIIAKSENDDVASVCSVQVKPNLAPSVTTGYSSVSAISVVLKGEANLDKEMTAYNKMGILFSSNPEVSLSNSSKVEATEISAKEGYEASYCYSVNVTGLEPEKTYYYRSFVLQNNEEFYGEIKEFTTENIKSLIETLDATSINASNAVLNAKLNLNNVLYNNCEFGFNLGTDESSLNRTIRCSTIQDIYYSANPTNLSHKSQYWFRAYVIIDNQSFYGEIKTFTTDIVTVQAISLNANEYTFHAIGSTFVLSPSFIPSDVTDKSVTWSSDKEEVATVDANGVVRSTGNGVATITVTTNDQGKTASCAITVSQWVTSLVLNTSSLTLLEGETANLSVTSVLPNNAVDKTYSWSSSDSSIASVNSDGKVTAKSKGAATIKAIANDGSGVSASCAVSVIKPVSSITLDNSSITVYNNRVVQLTATVRPSDASNTSVSWESSDTSIATVSSSGLVKGVSRGYATITAHANDGSGISATCEVEVKQLVTSITLDQNSLYLLPDEEAIISVVSVLPENANDKTYSWSSSNTSIATVDQDGKVKAIKKGYTTIKAIANDDSGKYASCSITVSDAVDMGLSVRWATCNIGASSPEGYGSYYAWGETETKVNYGWSYYKWYNEAEDVLTKYNTKSSNGVVDNKKVLEPEDDIAHVRLGGRWRMPTDNDWKELYYNCKWVWTTQDGVNGMRVTSNKNGNSIFLPAAGQISAIFLDYKGSYGYYWSSSLTTDGPRQAQSFYFYSTMRTDYNRSPAQRCYGFSIRPVYE